MDFVGCMACGKNIPIALIRNSICPKCGQDVREIPVFPTVQATSKRPRAQSPTGSSRITITPNELQPPKPAPMNVTPHHICCPYCDTSVLDDGSLAGQVVQCPGCSNQFEMPIRKAQPAAGPPFAAHQQAWSPQPTSNYQQPSVYLHSDPKNSGIAAVLSFFWCGVGQIYNGQIFKGIMFIVVQAVFALLSFFCIGIPFYVI